MRSNCDRMDQLQEGVKTFLLFVFFLSSIKMVFKIKRFLSLHYLNLYLIQSAHRDREVIYIHEMLILVVVGKFVIGHCFWGSPHYTTETMHDRRSIRLTFIGRHSCYSL